MKMNRQLIVGIGLMGITLSMASASPPFANRNNSTFYYEIGGGQSLPPPATRNQIFPIDVSGNIGPGYSCGAFDPQVAITNTLNDWENSFSNIADSILANATAHITAWPSYAIARANPTLYDMLTNNLFSAHEQLQMSTATCEAMEQQIAQGQNPYQEWQILASHYDWQDQMSVGGDINRARQTVEENQGRAGIPWVGDRNAGGQGQPPIFVIEDTSIAGYNLLLDRDVLNTSPPTQAEDNRRLTQTWASPLEAANWIVAVVGDQKVSTFAQGDNDSVPGVGLLPATENLAMETYALLSDIVAGNQAASEINLTQVSAPGMRINTDIIYALNEMEPNQQAFVLDKVSQELAIMTILDYAMLAKQILTMGSQVPAIKASPAAQEEILRARQLLDEEMNDLLFTMRVGREMVSGTLLNILLDQQNRINQSVDTPFFTDELPPSIEDGAVFNN